MKDEILQQYIQEVLTMMFVEEDLQIQPLFQKKWADFMTWLLVEKQLPPSLLLGYLKMIQTIIRKNYKRYVATINYYFDPSVFEKSFRRTSLWKKHEKNIFLKQLIHNFNQKAGEQVLTQEKILSSGKKPTMFLGKQQSQQVSLNNMKKQLSRFRDSVLEGREALILEELETTLDLLFSFEQSNIFPKVKKVWYETLKWILTLPLSKQKKIQIMKLIQNHLRVLSKTKKPFLEMLFPPADFRHYLERGKHARKNIFINQILDHLRNNYGSSLTIDKVFYGSVHKLFGTQQETKTYVSVTGQRRPLPPKPKSPPHPPPSIISRSLSIIPQQQETKTSFSVMEQ
jgi:hypothetical protein